MPASAILDKTYAFRQAEYDKAFETYRTQILLIVRTISGFVVLNATVVGIALTVGKAWLFLAGAVISIVVAFLALNGERATRPFLMRSIQIEFEMGDGDSSIASMWAAWLYGVDELREFQIIANLERVEEKTARLRRVTSRLKSSVFLLLVYLGICGQIVLAVVLPLVFGWSFV